MDRSVHNSRFADRLRKFILIRPQRRRMKPADVTGYAAVFTCTQQLTINQKNDVEIQTLGA